MIRISTTALANGLIDAQRRVSEATVNGALDMDALEASWARSYSRVSRAEGAIIPALSIWQEGSADHIARAFAARAADILGVTFEDVDSPVKLEGYFTLAQSARESYSKRTASYLGTTQEDRRADVVARTPETPAKVTEAKRDPFANFRETDSPEGSTE
jgi:hypothetical protein